MTIKSKKAELDTDFIGGTTPLTKEEERAISEFLRSRRERPTKKRAPQHRLAKSGGRSKNKVLKTRAAFGKP